MATTLNQALETVSEKGGARASVRKHLEAAGIRRWSDINRTQLYNFRDMLMSNVSPSTAKTILARTSAMFERFSDEVKLPDGWKKILSCKGDEPMRVYLTPEELAQFEAVQARGDREEIVKIECLLEAYIGARVSDICSLTEDNIQGNNLVYVSKKTHKKAAIPVGEKVRGWLRYYTEHKEASPKNRSTRCGIIVRLCKRAGIDTPVVVHSAAKDESGPKYLFVTSHTFRISFVTNLHGSGLDLLTISRMAGHSDVSMTERYCAVTDLKLSEEAQKYLGIE